jgi:FixJ family two-component response regulator
MLIGLSRYEKVALKDNSMLVAIIDDDELVRDALRGLMKEADLDARVFASAEDFLDSELLQQTGCLIADIHMPAISGLELQQTLNAMGCRIPTIFITADGDSKMRLQAMRAGAVEFLTKPFDDDALLQTVRAALKT